MNTFKKIMFVFSMVLLSGCAIYNYGNRDNEEPNTFFLNDPGLEPEDSWRYHRYSEAQKYMNKSQEEILRIAGTPDKIINTNEKVFWMYKIISRFHINFLLADGDSREIILEFNKSGRVVSVEIFNKSRGWSFLYPNWISE